MADAADFLWNIAWIKTYLTKIIFNIAMSRFFLFQSFLLSWMIFLQIQDITVFR